MIISKHSQEANPVHVWTTYQLEGDWRLSWKSGPGRKFCCPKNLQGAKTRERTLRDPADNTTLEQSKHAKGPSESGS